MRRTITELPEKWAINAESLNDEQYQILSVFINGRLYELDQRMDNEARNTCIVINPDNRRSWCGSYKTFHTELTFNEFRHLVLGELKLVGFKAPIDMPFDYIKNGDIILYSSLNKEGDPTYDTQFTNLDVVLVETFFEPIYEEVQQTKVEDISEYQRGRNDAYKEITELLQKNFNI